MTGRTYSSRYDWTPGTRSTMYYREPGTSLDVRDYSDSNELQQALPEEEKQIIRVNKLDYNVADNIKGHHTEKYEVTDRLRGDRYMTAQLVVRRGQSFDVTVTFDRPYDKEKDDLELIFDIGDRPMISKGTRIMLRLSDEDKPKKWGAKIKSTDGDSIVMTIMTPPECLVGKWAVKIDSIFKSGDTHKRYRYTHKDDIYMLFNPWCPDDTVFIDDDVSRNEYVLNDVGKIYSGTSKQIHPKPWNFGQFEDFVIDCCMWILDQSNLSYKVRGNPVSVARKISAMTNAPGDNGVLVGNWSGKYSGGTSPLAWAGSVSILEEYWRTRSPVSFGQCWVFSGVVTTICRCLGIPARSVTNFASAHDTDGSITIDNHWSSGGQPIEEYNADSVWNFHVWNDVWMARPDLPSGFGGWQAIDATPQETSDGVYCAGPASLEALKNGLVNLPYDGAFIFAEVNADKIHWIHSSTGEVTNVKEQHAVGKKISTKQPAGARTSGRWRASMGTDPDREDITGQYKYPEDSHQERTAVWRAAQEASTYQEVYQAKAADVVIDLLEKEEVLVGKPFDVKLKVRNKSSETRTVKASVTATIVYYTGVPVDTVKSEDLNIILDPNSSGEVKMSVAVDDYMNKLVDMCMIRMNVMANVQETKQIHCESDDFRLCKPPIVIKVPEKANVNEEFTIEASFTNSLPIPLTKCEFVIEGPGLQKPKKIKHGTVAAGGDAVITEKLKPMKTGVRTLIVSFDSVELSDMSNSADITVS